MGYPGWLAFIFLLTGGFVEASGLEPGQPGPGSGFPDQEVLIEGLRIRIPQRELLVDYSIREKDGEKVIDILAQDRDYRINLYVVTYYSDQRQQRLDPIFQDYALSRSDLSGYPKNEIPIRFIRASCVGGTVYAGLVTLALDPVLLPQYRLYLLKKYGVQYYVVDQVEKTGQNLTGFLFADLDGDCLPEMVDLSRPALISFARVWRVNAEDRLQKIQEMGGHSIRFWRVLQPELHIVNKQGFIEEDFKWSSEDGRFVDTLKANDKNGK